MKQKAFFVIFNFSRDFTEAKKHFFLEGESSTLKSNNFRYWSSPFYCTF